MRAVHTRARGAALRECHPEVMLVSPSMSDRPALARGLSQREFQILCKLAVGRSVS